MTTDFQTFDLTRDIAVTPETLFRCWTETDLKARWFADGNSPDWTTLSYTLDPIEGGEEIARFQHDTMGAITYRACLIEIRAPRRLIYSYQMLSGDDRISASLSTVTFAAAGAGTKLTYTEQIVFLDGQDSLASRIPGTEDLLDKLVRIAPSAAVPA